MKIRRYYFFLLLSFAFSLLFFTHITAQEEQSEDPHPAVFITDFPDVQWGMTLDEAKEVLDNLNIRSVNIIPSELAWDGKFEGILGRASLYFDNNKLHGMSLVQYAKDFADSLELDWDTKIMEKYGDPINASEDYDYTTKLWKINSNFILELRKSNLPNASMVSVNWVKKDSK